jgi:integrase
MYLHQRSNGFWYFRRRVPTDLAGVIDPKQFHYSLKTKIRRDAVNLYAAALAESEKVIEEAREKIKAAVESGNAGLYPSWSERRRIEVEKRKRGHTKVFSQYNESDIQFLFRSWYEGARKKTEANYRDAFLLNDAEERAQILQDLREDERYLVHNTFDARDMAVSGIVRKILEAEDCSHPQNWLQDPLFRRFYGMIFEGLLQLKRISISLIQNYEMPQGLPALGESVFVGMQHAPLHASVSVSNAVTLKELLTKFEEEPSRQHLRETTRKEYQIIYRALREHLGENRPLVLITREDVKAVAETFRYLPSRATLNNRSEPLKQIAERAKREGKTADVKTYNKKAHNLSAIFRYAHVEQMIGQNLGQSLALPEPPASAEEKPGYSVEQLNTIFGGYFFRQFITDGNALQMTPNHEMRPCYFWVPLLGLFLGARSNELLQIKTNNVFVRDGVNVVKLEGRVKNYLAFRLVPIHPELVRLGFLDYVERVKSANLDRIFPDAKLACDGKYSTWFQKPFARYLTKVGVKHGRGECFHTFRHTWTGGLRRGGVAEEYRQALGGWKRSNASAETRYGPQHFPLLHSMLCKLDFPGLLLDHLRPVQVSS